MEKEISSEAKKRVCGVGWASRPPCCAAPCGVLRRDHRESRALFEFGWFRRDARTGGQDAHPTRRMLLASLFAFLFFAVPAWAAPNVSASLSSATVAVGESVDLEVTVQGTVRADEPSPPNVDGLEFRGMSQSNQMIIIRSEVTQGVSYTLRYVAKREGTFTFPAMDVVVGGQQMKTNALTLTVKAGAQMAAPGDVAFAVIEPLKKTAFVGEDIGVEIRVYLDATTRWSNVDKPQLNVDGFNPRDILPGRQSELDMNGRRYIHVVYRTVVTPTKAGKLALGDAKLRALFSRQRRSPYDPFGGFGRAEEMNITAPAVTMEIKPLPSDGRPKDFAGAVGQFKFRGTGAPAKVKIGEPVTMTLVIEGQGNFDRITTPPLAESDGWNTYDSEDTFSAADDLRIMGTKTFKLPVSPLATKTTMPVFAFTFFDPSAEKYVTLKNDATPLLVEGSSVAPAPIAGQPAQAPPPEAKADLLPNLPAPGATGSLRPALTPTLLFGAILAPLPILFGLLAWRSRKADPLAGPLAALSRERSVVAAKLRSASDRAELFEAVGRLLQIDTAVARREPTASFDDAEILASRENADAVRELLAARSELLFAGGGRGEAVSAVERDRVMEAVAAWEKCRPTKTGRAMPKTAICLLLAGALLSGAHAGDFENGNAAFAEGKFDDARRAYERVLADGWQPGVLFNLGNTHFRLDKPGRAALNYERVLALTPTHPDAKANLKFVREQSHGRVAEPTWYEAAFSIVPSRATPWIAIGVAWLGWLWAGAALWRKTGIAGVVGGTLLVLMGAGFGVAQIWQSEQRANDVIVMEQCDARREPADRATLAEALGPGSRVRVISEQGEWIFVELPGGQKGWLKAGTLERIVPLNHR